MSLKLKIVLIVVAVMAAYFFFDYMIEEKVIFPQFVALEEREADRNVSRCVDAVKREIFHLDTFTADWSNWDDTYKFAVNHDPNFIISNLPVTTFRESHLNIVLIADIGGNVVWKGIYDDNQQPISIKAFDANELSPSHSLFAGRYKDLTDKPVLGIFMTEHGPMFINAKAILDSHQNGPSHGTLVMGRFLDDDIIKALAEQTRVEMQIRPAGSFAADKEVVSYIRSGHKYLTHTYQKCIKSYAVLEDVSGAPAMILCATTPRDISQYGRAAMNYALYSRVFSKMSLVVLLLVVLQFIIIKPLSNLTSHLVKIGASDDLTARINIRGKGELGILANEFNKTLEKLAAARKKLLDMTYDLGKTDLAAGILHNLRNSLTPVVSRIHSISSNIHSVHIENIQSAKQQLSDVTIEKQRKADLEQYLTMANEMLFHVFADSQKQVDEVAAQIRDIESFFVQQSLERHGERPLEQVQLRRTLDESIKMASSDLLDNITIEIDQSIDEAASFKTERIAILQIFSNIMINAAESIKLAGKTSGTIRVCCKIEDDGHKKMLHIQFADNGQGIAAESMGQVFKRGFSTKHKASLSGIGLHWCANTQAAMGGRIWLESAGLGNGACAHVMIPFITENQPSKAQG